MTDFLPPNLTPAFNDESATTHPDLMSEVEYNKAFERMARDYFTGRLPQETPQLFYVTGLPGAGKSTYVDAQLAANPALKDYVHINFDDLRIYHPRYAEHVSKDPVNAAARIDQSVERLIGWLTEEATTRRLNVLLDDAAMGADITKAIFSPFQAAGYEVNATIIAVPSSIARQDVHLRFEENFAAAAKGNSVIPRWVNSEEQDNAPTALMETVETLQDGISAKLRVVARNGVTLLGNAAVATRGETQRELVDEEKADYQAKAQRIAGLHGLRTGKQATVTLPVKKPASGVTG